jgi:uncharacterized protein (TIGR02231 family)
MGVWAAQRCTQDACTTVLFTALSKHFQDRYSVQNSITWGYAMRPTALVVLLFTILAISPVYGWADDQPQPTSVDVEAAVNAVTLYRGRASVTRRATVELQPGLYELRFNNLPESVQASALQARADGSATVIGVEFSQEAAIESGTQQIKQLDAEIEKLQLAMQELQEQRELIKAQEDFVNAVSIRITNDASAKAGESSLNLDEVRKQMKFIADERSRLLSERRELDAKQRELAEQLQIAQAKRQSQSGNSGFNRTGVVIATVQQAGPINVDLTYLVANATWEPTYNVRAMLNTSTAHIDYDALLTQRTGEDWENVTLTLSTAQPMVAANPPVLQPWYVDIFRPMDRYADVAEAAASPLPPPPAARRAIPADELADKLNEMSQDALVQGGGPSVTFLLPRTVTVKSDSQKQQTTRIATIDGRPKFVHVAVPSLTDAVYIRGELINTSLFQLLRGRASIFVGQDYVGPTVIDSVAPNGEFKIHFGIDNAVKASRRLVSKRTENTGLLSGGRRTIYDYRLAVDNGSGKTILVELWDRYPVSRSSDIQVTLPSISDPLSNDAYYIAQEKPQGMLKWILNVLPSASGSSAYVVSYSVEINRAKDIEISALPE